MTEPTGAVRAHHGNGYRPGRDERAGCRPGNRPAGDPPSPDAGPDSVTDLLRRLRDAAAAHDGE
jgi:hypothetical protein